MLSRKLSKVTYAEKYTVDAVDFFEYCHVCGLSLSYAARIPSVFCLKCWRKIHRAPESVGGDDTRPHAMFLSSPYPDYNHRDSCEAQANLCKECAGVVHD